jgi:hypothetical protein
MKGRSTNYHKYYHKHVFYYASDHVGPRVLEFLWLDTCSTIVRQTMNYSQLCHCLRDWFFFKTAPRMQEDYESHCVTVYNYCWNCSQNAGNSVSKP